MKNIFTTHILLLLILMPHVLHSDQAVSDYGKSNAIYSSYLKKSNYGYFGDWFNHHPTTWIGGTEFLGEWSALRMRGSDEDQVTMLIDGFPLTDPLTGSNDLNLIPAELVDRIEVYPSLNPFGINSIGGVVNIVSRRLETERPYTRVVYRYISKLFSDLDITYSQKISPRVEIISGVLIKKYGYNKEYASQKTRIGITYRPSKSLYLRYTMLNNNSDIDLPFDIPIPGDTTMVENPNLRNLRYDHLLLSEFDFRGVKTSLRISLMNSNYIIRGADTTKTIPVDAIRFLLTQKLKIKIVPLNWGIEHDINKTENPNRGRYVDSFTRGFLSTTYKLPFTLNTTPQFNFFTKDLKRWYFFFSNKVELNMSRSIRLWGFYGESIRIPSMGEKYGLIFHPSMTHDDDRIISSRLLNNTFFYRYINKNFIVPHTLHINNNIYNIIPNPYLRPERSKKFEAGILISPMAKLDLKLAIYRRMVYESIQPVLKEFGYTFSNIATRSFQGIEGLFCFKPFNFAGINVNFHILESSKEIFSQPRYWGEEMVMLTHSFFKGDLDILLNISHRYWSGFKFYSTGDEGAVLREAEGCSILNFKASFTIIKNAIVTYAIDNVLNKKISLIPGYSILKRNTRISISWELLD